MQLYTINVYTVLSVSVSVLILNRSTRDIKNKTNVSRIYSVRFVTRPFFFSFLLSAFIRL